MLVFRCEPIREQLLMFLSGFLQRLRWLPITNSDVFLSIFLNILFKVFFEICLFHGKEFNHSASPIMIVSNKRRAGLMPLAASIQILEVYFNFASKSLSKLLFSLNSVCKSS